MDIFPFPCPASSTPRQMSVSSTDWAVDLWPQNLARADWSTDEQLTQVGQCDSFFPDLKKCTAILLGFSRACQLGKCIKLGLGQRKALSKNGQMEQSHWVRQRGVARGRDKEDKRRDPLTKIFTSGSGYPGVPHLNSLILSFNEEET